MKRNLILFMLLLVLQSCNLYMDAWYELDMYNNSNDTIISWFANINSTYPDSILPKEDTSVYFETFHPYEKGIVFSADYPFEKWFASDSAKISIFVFSKDTLDQYSWEVIRENYKILIRYDLGYEDIKKLDYTISFPPSKEMEGMNMYPPYSEW